MAIPIQGGERKLICGGFCGPAWSADGRYFYVSDHSLSRTLVMPVRPGEAFPEFPADGSSGADVWASRSGTRFIEEMSVAEGSAPERYVSVRVDQVRNLFRIPIR